MGRPSCTLVVTTSGPTSAATALNGGSLTMVCPRTGSVQSSCRIHGGDMHSANNNGLVGVRTLSFFPTMRNSSIPAADPTASLAIAYGSVSPKSNGSKQREGKQGAEPSYGMLFTIRHAPSAAPILHWKCHLPEQNLSGGLLVSPVSRHVIGGGSTGTLYVWNPLQGGHLVKTIPGAHYRAITCMQWSGADANAATISTASPWDCHLVTGGADGMVHVFSHLDLVEVSPVNSSHADMSDVQPIRTWTKHHLAVSAITPLTGGRMVSASEDGQLVLMELCSGGTIAIFQMPDPIRCLTTDTSCGRQLFAGNSKGVVHVIDLDEYAIHQTVQMGATILQTFPKMQPSSLIIESMENQVFGQYTVYDNVETDDLDKSAKPFLRELRGHDRAITSLAVYDEEYDGKSTQYLVSGDEIGIIRIWDWRRECCLRYLHPWSHSSDSSDGVALHPVTSIRIMKEEICSTLENTLGVDSGLFTRVSENKRLKGPSSFASMILPLQKYVSAHDSMNVPVPFLEPRRRSSSMASLVPYSAASSNERKRQQEEIEPVESGLSSISAQQKGADEVERLQKELADAKATIQRWEIVNSKLMLKLQSDSIK